MLAILAWWREACRWELPQWDQLRGLFLMLVHQWCRVMGCGEQSALQLALTDMCAFIFTLRPRRG